MQVNPDNYSITTQEIKQRLNLSSTDMVSEYGYETKLPVFVKDSLCNSYDLSSLFVRTQPDFIIRKNGIHFLVEAKQSSFSVEAIQLFFNQQLVKFGINIIYSFPDFYISAQFIQINEIIVPSKYSNQFNQQLKSQIQESIPGIIFSYCGNTKGSGDPYVILDPEYLQEFSETEEI